jgi:hypothetical protein
MLIVGIGFVVSINWVPELMWTVDINTLTRFVLSCVFHYISLSIITAWLLLGIPSLLWRMHPPVPNTYHTSRCAIATGDTLPPLTHAPSDTSYIICHRLLCRWWPASVAHAPLTYDGWCMEGGGCLLEQHSLGFCKCFIPAIVEIVGWVEVQK